MILTLNEVNEVLGRFEARIEQDKYGVYQFRKASSPLVCEVTAFRRNNVTLAVEVLFSKGWMFKALLLEGVEVALHTNLDGVVSWCSDWARLARTTDARVARRYWGPGTFGDMSCVVA